MGGARSSSLAKDDRRHGNDEHDEGARDRPPYKWGRGPGPGAGDDALAGVVRGQRLAAVRTGGGLVESGHDVDELVAALADVHPYATRYETVVHFVPVGCSSVEQWAA